MSGEGKTQRRIIGWLQQHPDQNVREIGRVLYPGGVTTPNELRGIRIAINGLIKKGMVEKSKYYHNGTCYCVTDQMRPRPATRSFTVVNR